MIRPAYYCAGDGTGFDMAMPHDHPLRVELNDEVHARPPEALEAPVRIGYLAIATDEEHRDAEWRHLCDLIERCGGERPVTPATHVSMALDGFRLKWERHTEFARYLFIVRGDGAPFSSSPFAAVPADWLGAVPGRVLVGAMAAVLPWDGAAIDYEEQSARHFGGNALIGSTIADGAGAAFTDFRIREDGLSRLLVFARSLTPRQAGRMVQRLLEIDTYRIAATLALPIARQLGPKLTHSERELARITAALPSAAGEHDEALLLDRLTKLEAEIELQESQHAYRFSAASAYYDLVHRRILELREERIQGLQTFQEFTERRLAPAMATCQSVAARQRTLSERVARVTQLLSTRVDVSRERQNQKLLESLDERARMQLRLQQTVEGLSIAAVTYYVVGLVGYAAKSLKAAGVAIDADLAAGIGLPIVALVVTLGMRRIRRKLHGRTG